MNSTTEQFVKTCYLAGRPSTYIVLRFPNEKYIISQIVFCMANVVLIIPTVLLNGILVFTISRCSQLREKMCCFLVRMQSTVDFAVGFISLPLFTYIRACEITETANCVANFLVETVVYIMYGLSLAIVCLMTCERYMGVLHPIVHRVQLTKRIVWNSVLCIIIGLMAFSLLRLVSERFYCTLGTVMTFLQLAVNALAYVKIFLAGRNNFFLKNNDIEDSSIQNPSCEKIRKIQIVRQIKLAKSCALVVFSSFLCFLPSPIIYLYYSDDVNSVDFRIVHSWSITIGALNSCLNSMIFFWKRPLLRIEALKVVKAICNT